MSMPENARESSDENQSVENEVEKEEIMPTKREIPDRTTRGKRYNE